MSKITVVTVSESDMFNKSPLAADMRLLSPQKVQAVRSAFAKVIDERTAFEAKQERMIKGVLTVGQSPDIKHLEAMRTDDATHRMFGALALNVRSFLFPQSQKEGKQDNETANLKSYRKVRQIANLIGHSDSANALENVAKVSAVCMFRFASSGHAELSRDWCETFLSSREFSSIDTATADLLSAIDDVRAKQMSGGAATQSGQMVRVLVGLQSAYDKRDGRNKNVVVNPDGLVLQALMVRFGQI
jgi:hypothetical protein